MNDYFSYHHNELYAEQVSLQQIARQFGTPCYAYSRAALESAYRAFEQALAPRDHLICYAVKANPNLAILNLFARMGAGFDKIGRAHV